jgi:hypothetical protein
MPHMVRHFRAGFYSCRAGEEIANLDRLLSVDEGRKRVLGTLAAIRAVIQSDPIHDETLKRCPEISIQAAESRLCKIAHIDGK